MKSIFTGINYRANCAFWRLCADQYAQKGISKIHHSPGISNRCLSRATSTEVEEQHTTSVERYLFSYKEIKKAKTHSLSKDGMMIVFVELNDDVKNADEFWSKLKLGLSSFKSQLPSGVPACQNKILTSVVGSIKNIYFCILNDRYANMDEMKEHIVDKAYTLFLSRSYEAVSIYEISKAIGFTKGALYHHFINKQELFKAVIDKYVVLIELSESSKEKTIDLLIDEMVAKAEKNIQSIFGEKPKYLPINHLALIIDAFRHYPKFASVKLSYVNSQIEIIKSAMANGVAKGELRNNINIDYMARSFFSICLGLTTIILDNETQEKAVESLKMQLQEFHKLLRI